MKSRIPLIILAATIVGISIIFTNHLAGAIAKEEQRKMETWAEATRLLLNDEYSDFIFHIIEQNENIPVIIVDDRDRYISARNFNEPKINVEQYYQKQIQRLKSVNPPIEIKLDATTISRPYQLDILSVCQQVGTTEVDRKLNVAITRARKQFFLVGNRDLLSRNALYADLISRCDVR